MHNLFFNCLISIFFLPYHTTLNLQHLHVLLQAVSVISVLLWNILLIWIILQKGNYFFIHYILPVLPKRIRIGINYIVLKHTHWKRWLWLEEKKNSFQSSLVTYPANNCKMLYFISQCNGINFILFCIWVDHVPEHY